MSLASAPARDASSAERPVVGYRREFLELLLARAPASVLDVGCGDGALVRAMHERNIRAVGADVDSDAVAALRGCGIEARLAQAEHLPFEDASFDWVTLQYSAHHLPHLRAAILECWRVARRGLLVIDPWYDMSIMSQRVALALDCWSKRVDRQRGMVHAECLGAAELLAPLLDAPDTRIEIRHWLRLAPIPLAEVRELVARQLASVPPSESLRREADALLEHVERDGASEDGAIVVAAWRC